MTNPAMPSYTIPVIDWAMVMPTVVVLVTGIVALLVEMFRPKQNNNVIVGVSLTGLAVAFGLLVTQHGLPDASTFAGLVSRDGFATLTQMAIVGGTFLCFLFSEPYLRNRKAAFGEFYPMALWAAAGGMIMVGTESFLMIFVGLEVLSISLYCLAGMARGEQKSEESAIKYFLLGSFASAFLLYGIALVYGASGTLSVDAFDQVLRRSESSDMLLTTGMVLILVGLGFKTALVPFHQWTPDVYQGAPTNVTGFMAVVSKIAAFGALYRVLIGSGMLEELWLPILGVLAVLTMTVGNLAALVQGDVKRALGYSSIAHAGYILVGLLAHAASPDTVPVGPALFYLLAYSFMTLGAFAVVSLATNNGVEKTRTRDLRGLWKRSPLAAGLLAVFMISLIGMPPTAGFFGKLFIFQSAWTAGLQFLAWALAINSAISVFYYLRIGVAAFGEDDTALTPEPARLSFGTALTCLVCAAGSLLLAMTPVTQITDDVRAADSVAMVPSANDADSD